MMPQAATENVICIACGADVRGDAVFCYNCGANVVASDDSEAVEEREPAMPVIHQDDRPDGTGVEIKETDDPRREQAAMPDKAKRPLTAAMLKRKKAQNRRPVEIEWQEPESESRVFLFASMAVLVLAILILAAALYLK